MREITEGRKRTHWIWFIFPQLAVLGRSVGTRLRENAVSLDDIFQEVLDAFYGGSSDKSTLDYM